MELTHKNKIPRLKFLHDVAFCAVKKIDTICTYDSDFDGIIGLERITPASI